MKGRLALLVLNLVARSQLLPARTRRSLISYLGIAASGAWLDSGSQFLGMDVVIGEETYVNHDCFFDAGAFRIGARCSIGTGVRFDRRPPPRDR